MSENVSAVDYQEPFSIRVGNFLISRGFDLANCAGFEISELSRDHSLGILSRDLTAKPRKLFGFYITKPRRIFLGTIWFDHDSRGADEQNWVFEVHGREHVELLKQLAEDLASTFNVKIALRLQNEQPCFESRTGDGGDGW
jgi:hypothetical protein